MKQTLCKCRFMKMDCDNIVTVARRITWLGFGVNVVLGILKVLAGVFGRSSAMVADGVHSFTDVVTDVIVLAFVGISHREANPTYQHGHGKFETFATMLLAVILLAVGVSFFIGGLSLTWSAIQGLPLPAPTAAALVMALISILAKEWLYRFTRHTGEKIGSSAVVANAWHHRSDALSSLATLAGVAGAMFLGPQWRVLDPLAAMVVSVFIIGVACKVGKPAIMELLEVALPNEIVSKMYAIIGSTPGVCAFHHFASRRNGNAMLVEFHIKVDSQITVEKAHIIATEVEHRLKAEYGNALKATIHIEPYAGQTVDVNNMCE
jgi:cation diffusion facilitator family transporter